MEDIQKQTDGRREKFTWGEKVTSSSDRQNVARRQRLLAEGSRLLALAGIVWRKGPDCFAPVLLPLDSHGGNSRVESYGSFLLNPPLTQKIPHTTARGKTPSIENAPHSNPAAPRDAHIATRESQMKESRIPSRCFPVKRSPIIWAFPWKVL